MCLANRNGVSRIKITELTDHSKGLLKVILELFSVKFKIEKKEIDDYESNENSVLEEEENEDQDQKDDDEEEEVNEVKETEQTPNHYFIFSCLGCQLDNKNRIEGIF